MSCIRNTFLTNTKKHVEHNNWACNLVHSSFLLESVGCNMTAHHTYVYIDFMQSFSWAFVRFCFASQAESCATVKPVVWGTRKGISELNQLVCFLGNDYDLFINNKYIHKQLYVCYMCIEITIAKQRPKDQYESRIQNKCFCLCLLLYEQTILPAMFPETYFHSGAQHSLLRHARTNKQAIREITQVGGSSFEILNRLKYNITLYDALIWAQEFKEYTTRLIERICKLVFIATTNVQSLFNRFQVYVCLDLLSSPSLVRLSFILVDIIFAYFIRLIVSIL